MYVEKTELENFRNYKSLVLNLNPKVNLVLGKNGEGKTNLLEAIHFGFTGIPLRFATIKDLVHNENPAGCHDRLAPYSRVNLEINRNESKDTISTRIVEQKRRIFLNDKPATAKSLNPFQGTIVFTPESLSAVKEGASQRRQVLDELWMTVSPVASEILNEYQKNLASRNKVLKNGSEGRLSPGEQKDLLESLNASFLPLATEVSWGRIQAATRALTTANEAYATLLKGDSVDLRVDYVISAQSAIDWSKNQVYDRLASRLKELQGAEIQVGASLIGPHKHDVRFLVNGKDARVFCSQGQQRAVVLAFKVAQARLHKDCRGQEPILLLDDVFSELYSSRREQLLMILCERRGQMILTAIDDSAPALQFGSDVSVYRVNKGQVT